MRRLVERPWSWPVLLFCMASTLGGCDRPDVAVVCHNANCTTPNDPARDDTIAALTASLALEHDGRPVIDGVEVDLLWSARTDACLFAHDHAQPDTARADRVAELIAAHLETKEANPSSRSPFYLKLELKGEVDESGLLHSRHHLNQHVTCALGVFHTIRSAAERSDRPLAVYFDSESPELLSVLASHPEWPSLGRPHVEVELSAAFMAPGVTGPKLADFQVALDAVSLHPDWIMNAELRALEARGIELTLWSRSLGARQLRAIADLEPRFVSTSDAVRLRRWLGD